MALEVTGDAVVGTVVWILLGGGASWWMWHSTRQATAQWHHRLAGYALAGLLAWIAVLPVALKFAAPFVIHVTLVVVAAVVAASGVEWVVDAGAREAERRRLMEDGAPVPDRRVAPAVFGLAGAGMVALLVAIMAWALFALGSWLVQTPAAPGSASQELVAVLVAASVAISTAGAWTALAAGIGGYVVQRYRVRLAKDRFDLARKRFEARLVRERLAAAAPILQNS